MVVARWGRANRDLGDGVRESERARGSVRGYGNCKEVQKDVGWRKQSFLGE